MQKLNRVLSRIVQIHPTVVDFWLIAVYTELDIKGNLFSSRNLMLQAIRNNSNSAMFYVEYFRFEMAFLKKIKHRRDILHGKAEKQLDFVDEEMEGQPQGEGVLEANTNILEIVWETIQEKFPDNLRVYQEIWKNIVKPSDWLEQGLKTKIKAVFEEKKMKLADQYLSIKVKKGMSDEECVKALESLNSGVLSKLKKEVRADIIQKAKEHVLSLLEQPSDQLLYLLLDTFSTTLESKLELITAYFK